MNRTMKKVLSIVMIIMMALTAVPMSAFAAKECLGLYDTHDFGAFKETTPSTCKTEGVATATCKRYGCNATKTQPIPVNPTAHTEFPIEAKAPTCTVSGNTAGVVCKECDVVISGYLVDPATGHKPVDVAAQSATCTQAGNTAGKKCSVCEVALEGFEVIPATGHSFVEYKNPYPSCETETDGKLIKACSVCSYKEDPQTIPWAQAHNFSQWSVIKAASCTEAGEMRRSCLICGDIESKPIEKLNHVFADIAAKEATCTEPGNTAGRKCLECTYREGGTAIAAKGHTNATVKGTAATCTTKGTTDKIYCSVCNVTITESQEVPALGHAMVTDTANSVAPTCTTTGIKAEKCSREGCGHKTKETVDATHSVATWTIVESVSCTSNGKKRGLCTKCNDYVVVIVEATGHSVASELSWEVKSQASCTKDGVLEAPCDVCSQKVTKPIPKTGHKEKIIEAVPATCKKTGLTEGKWCEYCGEETVAQEIIPLADHTPGEWTIVNSASCEAEGKKTTKCTVCGTDLEETIKKTDHTKVAIAAKAPTCTEPGNEAGEECSVCKAILTEALRIEPLGHQWTDLGGSVPATCTTDGVDNYKCSVCGEEKKGTVPATGHKNTETVPGTAATCTQPGKEEGVKCKDCDQWVTEQKVIDALDHNWILDTEKSKAANCEEDGYNFYGCSRCVETKQETVNKLEHAWSGWIVDVEATCESKGEQHRECANCKLTEKGEIDNGGGCLITSMEEVAATCETAGSTGGTYCSRCKRVYEPATVIPAIGHSYKDSIIKATISEGGQIVSTCENCENVVTSTIDKISSIKLAETKFTYTGEEIKPEVIVADASDELLVEGQDFDCEYSEDEVINPGEYKVKVVFKGEYDGTKTLTFTVGAGKTDFIETTATKKGTMKLEWDEVPGATGYRVYVYKSTGSKTRKRVASVEATSYTLTKDYSGKALKMGKDYKIAIVAYTKLEDGTVIHAAAGVAKTFTQTPGKPTLKAKSTTKGKVALTWTDLVNEGGYTVFYSTSKNGTYKKLTGTKADVAKFTASLTPGKTYYFKVRGYVKVDGETFRGLESSAVKVTVKK